MPKRTASAVWNGGLKGGNGTMKSARGGIDAPYSFPSRFEEGNGMSPEDLIAAAHAGCFSMAFAATLEQNGFKPQSVETTADVTLEQVNGAPTISKINLTSKGRVDGIDAAKFHELAEDAKKNCPVSRLYTGAAITLTVTLEQ
jgi:osmotically inducible protein OsmC